MSWQTADFWGLPFLYLGGRMESFEKKTQSELREKANRLPTTSGVYIMYGSGRKIIYIGKSKALKNRVSQYFTDSAKNAKTAKMVSSVWDFEYMLTNTEMEALVLENKLIKMHQPKYNILLKDAKNYPYIKVTVHDAYPKVLITRVRSSDGARYFGPYSGNFAAKNILHTVQKAFQLPTCKLNFPKDIGKSRPCLYQHIGQCCAPCSGSLSSEDYKERFPEILAFLRGSYSEIQDSLKEKMQFASQNLQFEVAAIYRDRLKSLESLWQRQQIVGDPNTEFDVISVYIGDACSCLAVYYVRAGAVIDSDNFIFTADQIVDDADLLSFLCDMYDRREYIPETVLLGFDPKDNLEIFEKYLNQKSETKVTVRVPKKGNHKQLCEMVYENAVLHAKHYLADTERENDVLIRLATLLSLEVVPESIESIDISNYGDEQITAGIISVKKAKFDKKGYRTYKINSVNGQDDYQSMREALTRRIRHAEEQPLPDLFLLDGGKGHVHIVQELFREKGVDVPVFGMIKDDFHKTRALTDGEREISIAREQAVFLLIYKIQEEVHRFTIGRMRKAKEKTLRHSSLEKIQGIGEKKAIQLIKSFGSIGKIKSASPEELATVKGISLADGKEIFRYFHAKSEAQNKKKED
jgi:excinuclease ABC subunit C